MSEKQCKLTRLSSVHKNLRTDEVIGFCVYEPMIGKPFRMMAPALEFGDARLVETSPVISIEGDEFHTENSHYKYEELV